ncbi:hypothetical protein COT72_02555 [archaeon CG10_big_fil_rev_8_21_14_0_10_43_11]|nr:MAG: hypothetical protein COT72_02555 [archaeon CG10_big_fil_rev_8_21_14_0_10_43_11]
MAEQKFERAPAKDRKIKHITSNDTRVRVVGVVVKKEQSSSSIVLNDGEENIVVVLPEDAMFSKANVGAMVSVFATVLPYEGGVELKAEAIQDASGLDKDLYTKMYTILTS